LSITNKDKVIELSNRRAFSDLPEATVSRTRFWLSILTPLQAQSRAFGPT